MLSSLWNRNLRSLDLTTSHQYLASCVSVSGSMTPLMNFTISSLVWHGGLKTSKATLALHFANSSTPADNATRRWSSEVQMRHSRAQRTKRRRLQNEASEVSTIIHFSFIMGCLVQTSHVSLKISVPWLYTQLKHEQWSTMDLSSLRLNIGLGCTHKLCITSERSEIMSFEAATLSRFCFALVQTQIDANNDWRIHLPLPFPVWQGIHNAKNDPNLYSTDHDERRLFEPSKHWSWRKYAKQTKIVFQTAKWCQIKRWPMNLFKPTIRSSDSMDCARFRRMKAVDRSQRSEGALAHTSHTCF